MEGLCNSPTPLWEGRGQAGLLEARHLQERELGSHGALSQPFPEGVGTLTVQRLWPSDLV